MCAATTGPTPAPGQAPSSTRPLQHLNLIQYIKGNHVICAAPHVLDAHLSKIGPPGLEVRGRGSGGGVGVDTGPLEHWVASWQAWAS